MAAAATDPNTRAPATMARKAVEQGTTGAAAVTLLNYAVGTWFPTMPQEVQFALIVLVMAGASMAFSAARTAGVGGWMTGAQRDIRPEDR